MYNQDPSSYLKTSLFASVFIRWFQHSSPGSCFSPLSGSFAFVDFIGRETCRIYLFVLEFLPLHPCQTLWIFLSALLDLLFLIYKIVSWDRLCWPQLQLLILNFLSSTKKPFFNYPLSFHNKRNFEQDSNDVKGSRNAAVLCNRKRTKLRTLVRLILFPKQDYAPWTFYIRFVYRFLYSGSWIGESIFGTMLGAYSFRVYRDETLSTPVDSIWRKSIQLRFIYYDLIYFS